MNRLVNYSTLLLMALSLIYCGSPRQQEIMKVNQVQVIGSHNSYKQKIEAPVMEMILARDSNGTGLDYYHLPIGEQLDLGLRGLEIDVLHDPSGGRFSKPVALKLMAEKSASSLPYDSEGELYNPGFKVLHIPDIDFRTHCYTFVACLSEIRQWSQAHPEHLPIFITINPKDSGLKDPGFTRVLPFTAGVLDSLDKEIRSVFDKSQLITPMQVRGTITSLREAVMKNGWPSVEESKGKILFVLDAGERITQEYLSLPFDQRLMFVNVPFEHEEAGFFIMNEPVQQLEEITKRVKAGFMVRTRADADTKEARAGDYTRLKAAIGSGAQLISTDYYLSRLSPTQKFEVTLNGNYQSCNPINAKDNCGL